MKSEFGIINENNDPVFIYVGEEPLAQIFDGDISVCFDEERPQTGNDVVSLDSKTKGSRNSPFRVFSRPIRFCAMNMRTQR